MSNQGDGIGALIEQFWRKVDRPTPGSCWLWLGAKNSSGYGQAKALAVSSTRVAHRISWELRHGPIPAGLVIDHLCRNRACVNPLHLRVCTTRENVMAPGSLSKPALNAVLTHCRYGHPFTPENTRVKKGERVCRQCYRETEQRRRIAFRAAGKCRNCGESSTTVFCRPCKLKMTDTDRERRQRDRRNRTHQTAA